MLVEVRGGGGRESLWWDLNTTWDCFEEEFVHLAVDSVVLVEESEMRKSVCVGVLTSIPLWQHIAL